MSSPGDAVNAEAIPSGTLAILVVYYLSNDDDLPILGLHLDRIERHTRVPFQVYGAANRVTPAVRAMLADRGWLQVCEIEPTELRGSREHAFYLDALMARARADGADRIATFDVDSFPIDDTWLEVMETAAGSSGLAGILRVENGDTVLPHPSGLLVHAEFLDRYEPSFSPDSDRTPEFRRFLHSTGQAGDTGLGFAYALWSDQLAWGRLLRSNGVDVHPIIAGIYADSVFHLAGVARGSLFRRDLARSRVHRITGPLERMPVTGGLGRVKRSVLERVRAPAERAIVERNRVVFGRARAALLEDSDAFVAYLRGGEHASFDADQ
ncbi:MAG: hypothetical protein ABIP21_04845 [Acidimicrobiia bacterium]